jgi:ERF superfamily
MSELTKALVEVQANLPVIKKGETAKVETRGGGTYSYKYVDLATVTAEILPLLAKAGLAWTTRPTFDDHGTFVLAYELRHISGEALAGWYPLPDAASKAQEIGSAITYARRYALCSVIGIAPDEDDDGAQAQNARPRQYKPKQAPKASNDSPPAHHPIADPETGEKLHNLTSLFLQEVKGEDRAKFIQWMQTTHGFQVAKVPESKLAEVEKAINEWSAGRPFAEGDTDA